MGDHIHAENIAFHFVHGQRGAIQRDRSFWRDKSRQIAWCAKPHAGGLAFVIHFNQFSHAIHMARNDMPPHLITQAQGPLKVDVMPLDPVRNRGFRHGLGRDIDREPILTQ